MTLFNKIIIFLLIAIISFSSPHKSRAADPGLTFTPAEINTTIDTPFVVSIMVDTAGFASGGVGTIINYDPFMFSATSIQTGKIFADYPMSSINNQNGKISISGIAASYDQLFSGTGEFAKITFNPNQLGSSTISFSFEPGSTTDSNIAVTFGNGDILTKVNKLKINITPATANTSTTSSNSFISKVKSFSLSNLKANIDSNLATLNLPFISNKYKSAREGRAVSKNLDPLNPITAQPPITDANSTQPTTAINYLGASKTDSYLPLIILLLILIIVILTSILIYNKSRQPKF